MTNQPLTVSVIGAAVSANKGAASMFYGLLDGLADAGVRSDVILLTTYKDGDEAALHSGGSESIPEGFTVRTVDAAPAALLLALFLALPIRLLDRFRIPLGPLMLVPLIRAVRETEVTVDLAGISFADGRGLALLGYNVVMSLFPYLAGGNIVKGSQAIGPTESFLTRLAARGVLPRMVAICARGARTRHHLDSLGLSNVVDAADLAFLMHDQEPTEAMTFDPTDSGSKKVVAVLPSSVVDSYAVAAGIDHIGAIAALIDHLSTEGFAVVVAPHSFRVNGERGRMNDGPVVSDIERRATQPATFINRDVDPRELRTIIRRADVAVTGRFHGMVSALEVGTPPVVVGWSHKYGEVLDQFNLGGQGIAVEELSADSLLGAVNMTLAGHDTLCRAISDARDRVHASARRNIEVILETAAGAVSK
jgi:polysaccharide pyruvyl transferase WcaK-like protein